MSREKVDAVIVGAGASGSVLAKELSEAGLKVVLLERGPELNPDDFNLHDEQTSLYGMTRHKPWREDERHPREFRHQGDERFQLLYSHQWGYSAGAAAVGGGMLVYGGLMWRRPPVEFRMKSEYGHLEGTTLENWCCSYDDLEPFFTKAEYDMGVSGRAGENPFEGHRSKPFPCPPVDLQPGDELIKKTVSRMGYHPFSVPLGIISVPYKDRPMGCIRHPCCNSYVCEVGAKSTPVTALLPYARATGNCTLIPEAMTKEITVDSRGNPNGVAYFDKSGKLVEQPARLIILAASAIESPRLLLNSGSRWFPAGMGNSSDWVGRNLMGHISPAVYGIVDETTNEGFGPGPGVGIDDFHKNNPGFVGGAVFYSRTEVTPVAFSRMRPRGAPRWGGEHKRYQRENFRKYLRLFAPAEDMPQFENRVEVSPTVRDAWGIPVARITHSFHRNDYRVRQFFVEKMTEVMQEAGARDLRSNNVGRGGAGYQLGTCRMGDDSKTSVVNPYGQSHDIDNLFVVDGSVFVTSGGRNPALTIQALAYRFADYIVRQWKGGAWREGGREV